MSRTYVAPTEPLQLRDAADVVSLHPEHYGCDILVHGTASTIGIQRKAVPDLLASLDDGRLAEQLVLMGGLDLKIILIEGPLHWTTEGVLLIDHWGSTISRDQFRKVVLSIRSTGCDVEYSASLADTIDWMEVAQEWADNEIHSTLTPTSSSVKGNWGERKRRHYQLQVLMGFPGIGPGLANSILDTVGWPFQLVADLTNVRGLGKKKLAQIEEVFGDDQDDTDT